MSNPRDTGRYDAFTDSYVDQQVRVDFAWGNIPMQPNDDRGMFQLDPELDSHIIATSGYKGFPDSLQGGIYDDTVTNVVMPELYGMTQIQAEAALSAAGFSAWTNNTTTSGANVGNNGKVSSQFPGPGTVMNADEHPAVVYFLNPQVAVPNLAGMNIVQVGNALTTAGLVGSSTLVTSGATSLNNGTVKSQTPSAGTMVDPGSTVNYQLYNYVAINYNIAGIRAVPGNIHQRYLYLQGRNHNLAYLDQITLLNTGVANYNRPFNVINVANDDSFNTGGTQVIIQNNLMDGTGGDVTNTGTYTKP